MTTPSNTSPDPSNDPTHPDIRSDAPGRIPESLINAAIDGELNDDIQREIAHALRYDPMRKQELLETADAINALQMPISAPDFADSILDRADRHRRFIPASWRRLVRTGRLGIAALLLLTLIGVAGLQRIYPRLTTLASQPTPVLDIESAMEQDTDRLASKVTGEVHTLRASVAPMATILQTPGRTDQSFELRLTSSSSPAQPIAPHALADARSFPIAEQLSYISFNTGGGMVYLRIDTDTRFTQDQSPLRLFASSGRLNGWVHHPESIHRSGDHGTASVRDLDLLDVPDLP
jgi:hypothetical protein